MIGGLEKDMRIWLIAMLVCAAMAAGEDHSLDAQAPGVITKGCRNTIIGGQPAERSSDATSDPRVAREGASPNVFINGRPAVTVGGQSNVSINDKPVAQAGDLTSGCPSNCCRG
jgi:uncharacterized Zn-binding protein involved in type VI secretion